MFTGQVKSIATASVAGGPMTAVASVEAIAGVGLAGDRYSQGRGEFQKGQVEPDQEITLIESEAVEAVRRDCQIDFDPLAARRNLVTVGAPLNHLVGREFCVGQALLRGIRLCEPCAHLEKLTAPGVRQALVHRGGLRAQIVRGGTISVGDPIEPVEAAEPSNA